SRTQHGEFHRLVQELRLDDDRFQRYFRLDRNQFDSLLGKVGPRISRMDTNYRKAICASQRLAVCLRFLATGDSLHNSLQLSCWISIVACIVADVSRAIWASLVEEAIAADFLHRWNFPNCVGSIDGKHVVIQAPANSGSFFHNYKGTFSIILLAVVDAKYCFRIVDVGGYGRTSDGGILANSPFGHALKDGTLGLPEDAVLTGAEHLGPQPHVFVGDEAFPLRRDLMRPFPGSNLSSRQRIFNYRLSRARLIVENTFGILTSQWRMYRRVIGISPANVEACVKATCVLHNFLRSTTRTRREPMSLSGEGDVAVLQDATRLGSNNSTREAVCGAVPWQPAV
uniref:Zgc:194221 n=1 Tax=Astyanax mexicanus TaxID=7994 RepID=A0A3B1IG47_ASTMX